MASSPRAMSPGASSSGFSFLRSDSPPSRLLVRGVNWLGDAVMTTPALLRLRELTPHTHITLLTPEKLADLWHRHPAVDSIMMFDANDGLWAVARELRAARFDLSLILPNSPRSALESFFAGIPRRVGAGGNFRAPLLTTAVPPRIEAVRMRKRSRAEIARLIRNPPPCNRSSIPPAAHHLYQYLHLVAALGADSSALPPLVRIDASEATRALAKFGLAPSMASSPLLGLHAGAEYGPAKRWPRDRFVTVALDLRRRLACRWIIFGGPAEVETAREIAGALSADTPPGAAPACSNVAGQTSLRELGALLKACAVVLTNDSGPMHLAAAVGTPVVAIFGSTSPELTGPGLPRDPRHASLRIPTACAPCFRRDCPIDFRCMTAVSVEHVTRAMLTALARV